MLGQESPQILAKFVFSIGLNDIEKQVYKKDLSIILIDIAQRRALHREP